MSAESEACLVVPCYNEERRIDVQAFTAFARQKRATLLLVDDGSTDGTPAVLDRIRESAPDGVRVLTLGSNRGKAEAVRLGLRQAIAQGAGIVGYADADLSTPFSELSRLLEIAEGGGASVVLGSRVALLGTQIRRSPRRHYLGRAFATVASMILDLTVYDTQCGAKFFRVSDSLRAALETAFISSWAFDVELIGRLLVGAPAVRPVPREEWVEVPLLEWREVGGSKLRPSQMAQVALELARITSDLTRRRRRAGDR